MRTDSPEDLARLLRWGAWAALAEGALYVLCFLSLALFPQPEAGWPLARKLDFVLAHRDTQALWGPTYLVSGALIVPLALALEARLRPAAGAWVRIATSFALIWAGLLLASGMVASVGLRTVARLQAAGAAEAVPVWVALNGVHEALGGGVEVVGGIWCLLISLAAGRARIFSRGVIGLGVVVGTAGVLTGVPAWHALGAVFGLGQILWFGWIGLHLLSRPREAPADGTGAGTAGYTGPFGAAQ